MADDSPSEDYEKSEGEESSDVGEKFSLELTASDMYSLRSILSWASIELPDPDKQLFAMSLSEQVAENIAGEDFIEQLDAEHEKARKEMEEMRAGEEFEPDIPGMGVQ